MKKLSSAAQKQQALVFSVANHLEQEGCKTLPGMLQCWFDVKYHQFPGSLLLRFQFDSERSMADALPQLPQWQKRLTAAMLKKGVIFKDKRMHLIFTLQGPED